MNVRKRGWIRPGSPPVFLFWDVVRAFSLAFTLAFALIAPPRAAAADAIVPEGLFALEQRFGAKAEYEPLTGTGRLAADGHAFVFGIGQPYAILDGQRAYRVPAPRQSLTGIMFEPGFSAVIDSAMKEIRSRSKDKYRVTAILVDPGHGGKDTGATAEHGSVRLVEKDITLESSLRIAELLRQRYPERKIMLTRETDVYPTLEDRVELANRTRLSATEAIIYVSIHANASFNKDARGYEVWYLNPEYRRTVVDPATVKDKGKEIAPILNAMLEEEFTTESIILARKVMDRLSDTIGKESVSRGIRAEEWFVVRNAKMPSILIEVGFITNPEEGVQLADESYLRRTSDAIYNGIVDFIDHFEG